MLMFCVISGLWPFMSTPLPRDNQSNMSLHLLSTN